MEKEISEVNYYDQAKEIALKQGWVTVSLIQRRLRLGYGYTLSLVQGLQHRGIVGPADETGRCRLITGPETAGQDMKTLDLSRQEVTDTLDDFYLANHDRLITVRESFGDTHLEGPLLMDLDSYWQQPVKLMIVGQETNGWNCDYDDLQSLKKTYREFNMGEQYYSSPFWNITRKIEAIIGIPAFSCAWTNLNRFDYEGGSVPDNAVPKLSELDYFVRDEVRIASPDVCLFYTNRKNDSRLAAVFSDLEFQKVEGLAYNHFCRLVHPSLPHHTYRTPHPRTIRMRGWESSFLSVMERLLAKSNIKRET